MPEVSTGSWLLFLSIVGSMWAIAIAAFWRASGRSLRKAGMWTATLSAWLVLTHLIASSGFLSDFSTLPPRFVLFLAFCFATTSVLAISRFGDAVLESVSPVWLVGFQAFRIPVEWFLDRAFHEGLIPVQMTFEGLNFDILSGIAAVLVALVCARARVFPRGLVLTWCVVGVGLLTTIVFIAATSTPSPIRLFFNPPANTLVTTAPYFWLPAFLVQAAWFGHLLVFRLCLRTKS